MKLISVIKTKSLWLLRCYGNSSLPFIENNFKCQIKVLYILEKSCVPGAIWTKFYENGYVFTGHWKYWLLVRWVSKTALPTLLVAKQKQQIILRVRGGLYCVFVKIFFCFFAASSTFAYYTVQQINIQICEFLDLIKKKLKLKL